MSLVHAYFGYKGSGLNVRAHLDTNAVHCVRYLINISPKSNTAQKMLNFHQIQDSILVTIKHLKLERNCLLFDMMKGN
jgi:hypothetical protein